MIYSVEKNDRKRCNKENYKTALAFFRNIPVNTENIFQVYKTNKETFIAVIKDPCFKDIILFLVKSHLTNILYEGIVFRLCSEPYSLAVIIST